MRNHIPILLMYSRLLMGVLILLLAIVSANEAVPWITTLILIGFFSDILDGIIARKLGISTVSLRKLDSIIDRIFWFLVLTTCFVLYPAFIKSQWALLTLLLIMEMFVFSFCLIKFYKIPSPHNFLAKLWGISIVLTLTEVVITGSSQWLFVVMIFFGAISRIDSLMIHVLLRKWDHDIPSMYHAYLQRQGKSFKRSDLLNG